MQNMGVGEKKKNPSIDFYCGRLKKEAVIRHSSSDQEGGRLGDFLCPREGGTEDIMQDPEPRPHTPSVWEPQDHRAPEKPGSASF